MFSHPQKQKEIYFYAFVDFDTYSEGTNVPYGSASLNN